MLPPGFGTAAMVYSNLSTALVHLSLRNSDLGVRTLVDMDGLDEPDLALVELHHQRRGAHTISKEAHALEQRPIGDAGCGKDDVLAGREVVGRIDALRIGDAH